MTWAKFTHSEVEAFEAALRAQIGTPWRHMGRKGCGYGHQTGLDCVGLAVYGALAVKRPVADLEAYSRRPDGRLEERIAAHLGTPAAAVGPRQIVLMRLDLQGLPRHVGYVSAAGTLIHSRRGTGGGVVEHALDDYWRSTIVRSWDVASYGAVIGFYQGGPAGAPIYPLGTAPGGLIDPDASA